MGENDNFQQDTDQVKSILRRIIRHSEMALDSLYGNPPHAWARKQVRIGLTNIQETLKLLDSLGSKDINEPLYFCRKCEKYLEAETDTQGYPQQPVEVCQATGDLCCEACNTVVFSRRGIL